MFLVERWAFFANIAGVPRAQGGFHEARELRASCDPKVCPKYGLGASAHVCSTSQSNNVENAPALPPKWLKFSQWRDEVARFTLPLSQTSWWSVFWAK